MIQSTINENTPYFFLLSEKCVLGTPRGIHNSDRTIDMSFQDFAKNCDLQTRLKLDSTISKNQGSKAFAMYLSAFASNQVEQEQRREYLINNGLVRILIEDLTLLKEVKEALRSN